MTKKHFYFIILCFFFNSSYSQVKVGLKSGLNFSNSNDLLGQQREFKPGVYAGTFLRFTIADKIVLQPELQYSVKGFKVSAAENNPGYTSKLDYINLPVLVGFSPVNNLFLLAGAEFGYLLKSTVKTRSMSHVNSDLYKKFDLGISLGVDYSFYKSLGVNLRYIQGLTYSSNPITLTNSNGETVGEIKDGKNKNFQLGLSYSF